MSITSLGVGRVLAVSTASPANTAVHPHKSAEGSVPHEPMAFHVDRKDSKAFLPRLFYALSRLTGGQ